MDVRNTIASTVPREGMNDLYQKIDKYVYEIRMMELDGKKTQTLNLTLY